MVAICDEERRGAVDVVVPTFQRPECLRRCILALFAQEVRPAKVIVVTRVGDAASRDVLSELDGTAGRLVVESVSVAEPGVIAALSAGVAASTAAVVAITDDDARPRPDWLRRILGHFEDPAVGAVGGRDVIVGQEVLAEEVGRFSRWGRLTGNHHVGTGPPRDVDVLKGVCMAFRAEAFALPAPGILRGSGAQVHFEVLTCRWAALQGWRLVYDPGVMVDHDPAPRQGHDQRGRPDWQAISDAAYNSLIAVSALEPMVLSAKAAFLPLVGVTACPGIVRLLVGLGRREAEVIRRFPPAAAGYLAAVKDTLRGRGRYEPAVLTARELRANPRAYVA